MVWCILALVGLIVFIACSSCSIETVSADEIDMEHLWMTHLAFINSQL